MSVLPDDLPTSLPLRRPSLRPITWAVGLGVLAAFTAGPNLTFGFLLLAAVLIRVHVPSYLASLCAGLGLAHILLPTSVRLGQRLLDHSVCGPALGWLGDHPLVALFDWDRYALIGGLALGALCSLVAAETIRLGFRLVLGPGHVGGAPSSVLRPLGFTTAMAATVFVAALLATQGPRWLGRRLLDELSAINGADVSAESCRVDLWTGRVTAQHVAIADPRQLTRDRLRIAHLTGDLRPGALLRGRFNAARLQVADVGLDLLRATPASPRGRGAERLSGQFAPPEREATTPDAQVDIEPYLADPLAVRAWCAQLGNLQAALIELRGDRPARKGPASRADLAALRSPLGQQRPTWRVGVLHVEELPMEWRLGTRAMAQLSGASSDPKLAGQPTQLLVIAPSAGAALEAHLNLHDGLRQHELRFVALDVPPQQLVDIARVQRVALPGQTPVHLSGHGWFDRRTVRMEVRLDVPTQGLAVRRGEPLVGLPCELWQHALAEVDRLSVPVRVVGSLPRPRMTIDPLTVREALQQRLAALGQQQWVQAIQEELALGEQMYAQRQPQTIEVATAQTGAAGQTGTAAPGLASSDATSPTVDAPTAESAEVAGGPAGTAPPAASAATAPVVGAPVVAPVVAPLAIEPAPETPAQDVLAENAPPTAPPVATTLANPAAAPVAEPNATMPPAVATAPVATSPSTMAPRVAPPPTQPAVLPMAPAVVALPTAQPVPVMGAVPTGNGYGPSVYGAQRPGPMVDPRAAATHPQMAGAIRSPMLPGPVGLELGYDRAAGPMAPIAPPAEQVVTVSPAPSTVATSPAAEPAAPEQPTDKPSALGSLTEAPKRWAASLRRAWPGSSDESAPEQRPVEKVAAKPKHVAGEALPPPANGEGLFKRWR